MRHVQFAETRSCGQAYIGLETVKAVENPRLVIGKLKDHGLPRPPTPRCISGFPCSNGFENPFEFGHVMGWELGGQNVPENIVPQYAEWQGSRSRTYESWANMEGEIERLISGTVNTSIFVAVVEYNNFGDTYPDQSKLFKAWKQFFDWDDYRIPTGFQVYVEPARSPFFQQLSDELLNPRGLGRNVDALTASIVRSYPGAPVYQKIWDHSRLPDQDKAFFLRNMAAFAVETAMRNHIERREEQVGEGEKDLMKLGYDRPVALSWAHAPYSPPYGAKDEWRFINDHPDDVRQVLKDDYKVPDIDATNLTTATMVQSALHGAPQKREVKYWTKALDELKKKHAAKYAKGKDKRLQDFIAKKRLEEE